MKEKKCRTNYVRHPFVSFILLMLLCFIVITPSNKAQAASSITRLTYNDEVYYLTSNQMDYVKRMQNNNNYDGVTAYIESLGEVAHYFAIEDGVLYGGVENYDEQIKEIEIPNNVHTIAECAFQGCSQLTKVSMSDNVKIIGYGGFADCSSLKNLKLSKNLESIGEYAFQNCSSLSNVSLPSNLTVINYAAFLNCTSLKRITIPDSVKQIKDFAFYGCSQLKSINIPSKVTEIGERAIDNCSSLEDVITTKGSYAEQYTRDKLECAVLYTSKPTMKSKSQYLIIGDTYDSRLYNSYDSKVTYKSTNAKVATVDKKGAVTAKSSGKATISATSNGTTISCNIVVEKKTVKNRVKQFAKNNTKASMSDYEIICLAHEWMIKNVCYDSVNYEHKKIPKVSHTSSGALLNGVAVCDGYAYAFKDIMDYFNIPCKIVVGNSKGEGHAWNLVKIKDQWYHVDVTYDDPIINGSNQNKKVYKTYFLINDSQMSKDHTWKAADYDKCTAKKIDKKFVSKR